MPDPGHNDGVELLSGGRRGLLGVRRSAREQQALVLDLSALEYVSSAGLRCFMMAAKEAKARVAVMEKIKVLLKFLANS